VVAIRCEMPYRIDIRHASAEAFDLLVELGALDVELTANGIAAILPDTVNEATVADTLGVPSVSRSPAVSRDSGSVWLLGARAVHVGKLLIAPANEPTSTGAPASLRLVDSEAFGTGHHPTTALCIEALAETLSVAPLDSMLDVGTGSGILALAALALGVGRAVGVDIDPGALTIAAENARLNGFEDRLELVQGGPDQVKGRWPLIVANVLAAPLIDMAPILVQRLAPRGYLILSGISYSLEGEVRRAYQHVGIRHIASRTRAGWTALVTSAPW
jgi:ribosomal protein L11 methyltransferase